MQALLTEDYVYGSASDVSSDDTEMAGPWSSHHRTASASAMPGQLRAPSTRSTRTHHVVHIHHAQPRTHSDSHAAASRFQQHPHGYPSRDELPVLPHAHDYDYEHDLEIRDDSCNEEESAAYDLLFFAGVDVESGAEGGGVRLPCSLSNPNPGSYSRPVRRRVTPRRYTEYERHEGAEELEQQQQHVYAREVDLEADESGFEGPEEVAEAGVEVERVPREVASRKRRPAPPAGSLAIPPLHTMSSANSWPDAASADPSEAQQLQQQHLSRPVLIPSVPALSGPSTSSTSGLVLPPVSTSSHAASAAPNAPPSPLHMPLLASLPLLPLTIPDLAHAPLTAAALAASAGAPASLPPTSSLPPLAPLSSAAAPADAAALLRMWEDAQRAQAQLLEARSAQAAVEEVVEEQRQAAVAAQGEAVAASQRLMAEVRALADRYCLWAALAQLRAEGPAAAAAAPGAGAALGGPADAAAAASDGSASVAAADPPAASAALAPAVSVHADSC